MKTSAGTRLVRQLVSDLSSGALIPRPHFQRLLVWSNKDKNEFIDTVIKGYPFPEIYIATGEVDLLTGIGSEMLVDGQQRITTLHQYFTGSKELRLEPRVPSYASLSRDEKTEFLNYQVAVRNLGIATDAEIIEVFRRINATSYALNAMEILHARYRGPLKKLALEVADDEFFQRHRSFSTQEVKRKRDVVYALTIIITMISTYFHRDDEIENYLEEYNEEFPVEDEVRRRFHIVRDFIEKANFNPKSRAWKKTDLLALFVELDRLLWKDRAKLDPSIVGARINTFYSRVETELREPTGDDDLQAYIRTTVQATNDRASRANRGRVLRKALLGEI
jgi:hypothetical protein